ncbi:hypothetical protein [Escherichia coli]|uniref:hypothetical protein n=1 Tax=Escherichia coli TaxID=562 RepID=UPI00207BCD64|nr:hypothetical protein [Escherichia coli]
MSVGALLRQWLMPDTIITSGGMGEQLKARIFWLIGPQCIGWFAGMLVVGQQIN